ncbi:FkbM family methyltransferase [Sediminibacterium sp.]|uniref:FkbM family methyltransferase n=1 Tax=Sediminibacterium sp. TaxID=1917865 RepID=UPI003F7050CD
MVQKVKSIVQFIVQKILGYTNYLFIFSVYKILRYRLFKDEIDFNLFIELAQTDKQSTIIDIGANVGYTGVIFAKAFPKNQVICYEPVSLLTAIIRKVVKFFGLQNITVKHLALGNSNQIVPIKTPIIQGVKKQGLSYIDMSVDRTDEGSMQDFLVEQVQMVSLDEDLLSKELLPIAGIKVDVENFEFFVLQGAAQLIKLYKPIVMAELWDNQRKLACIELMKELGYEVKVISNNQLEPYTSQQALNYFFIPKYK